LPENKRALIKKKEYWKKWLIDGQPEKGDEERKTKAGSPDNCRAGSSVEKTPITFARRSSILPRRRKSEMRITQNHRLPKKKKEDKTLSTATARSAPRAGKKNYTTPHLVRGMRGGHDASATEAVLHETEERKGGWKEQQHI